MRHGIMLVLFFLTHFGSARSKSSTVLSKTSAFAMLPKSVSTQPSSSHSVSLLRASSDIRGSGMAYKNIISQHQRQKRQNPWLFLHNNNSFHQGRLQKQFCRRSYSRSPTILQAKPKSGSIVDTYRTVSVNCAKCRTKLFRYKKKNGTKSNLIKCYVERIVVANNDDSDKDANNKNEVMQQISQIQDSSSSGNNQAMEADYKWTCPNCQTQFARSSMIHGRPALKLVGGKVRMTKK